MADRPKVDINIAKDICSTNFHTKRVQLDSNIGVAQWFAQEKCPAIVSSSNRLASYEDLIDNKNNRAFLASNKRKRPKINL